jgi:uncharacterized membrane protein YkoI
MTSKFASSGYAGAAVFALVMVGTVAAQSPGADEAITPEQAIECIRTAVAATPGRVEGMEVDREKGQLLCEVEIVAENGSKAEVHVDVSANKVVRRGG